MKNIETVILELTPYEAAILRHALLQITIEWRHDQSIETAKQINKSLEEAGIRFLWPDEVKKGKILKN